MDEGLWITGGLVSIIAAVLLLPFLSKKIEEELEIFLFIMGVASVSVSKLWSWHLIKEAMFEPIKITIAVLFAGLIFRIIRSKVGKWAEFIAHRLGYGILFFIIVVGLGLLSSVITAIIAALVLAEVISALKLSKNLETKIVIITCFSIGLGAVLTPLGEPLATIAIAKLKGPPHNADFFFLFRMLGVWIIPGIIALGILSMFFKNIKESSQDTLTEDKPETINNVIYRSFRVYVFVLALVFLGTGFTPLVDKYLTNVSPRIIYWINSVSAILDNATLTATEITPAMSEEMIRFLLLGLLIAGGMLIPGNIPNIICANKLSIKSKTWAVLGMPLGLALMLIYFVLLILTGH
jgi:predicted cation transporter